MQYELPFKPRRSSKQHQRVPVHQQNVPNTGATRKTFSANFVKPPRHHPHVQQEADLDEPIENDDEIRTSTRAPKTKISRKVLTKEVDTLKRQNDELQTKLNDVESYLNKKNCKLKEKMQDVENCNADIVKQNESLKQQLDDLTKRYDGCKEELHRKQNCLRCLELGGMLEKVKTDYTTLKRINQDLDEDVNMLKTVVYRLNVQLERYQDKQQNRSSKTPGQTNNEPGQPNVPSDHIIRSIIPESHWDHAHTPISWGKVNTHTLGPLLDAYQDTIQEKEDIILNYEMELSIFTKQMREIMKENENLYKRLSEDGDCSKVLRKDIESITIELKSTKDQNDLLIKKCALKQDKLEEVLKCYENKIDMLKRDYKVMHDEYFRTKNDLAILKEKNKALMDQHDDFKSERQQYIPVAVHTASVNECKRWYEELKLQYEKEKEKLNEAIRGLNEDISQLNTKVFQANQEKLSLESSVKEADNRFKIMETRFMDMEHALNEVQLSRGACKKQLHKAMAFARDLVTEQESLLKTLNERQQENKAVRRIGSNIASRMEVLRNQLKTVQKEAWQELSTVEDRLMQKDSLIQALKQEHSVEVHRLRIIIREKEKHEKNLLLNENHASISLPQLVLIKDRKIK